MKFQTIVVFLLATVCFSPLQAGVCETQALRFGEELSSAVPRAIVRLNDGSGFFLKNPKNGAIEIISAKHTVEEFWTKDKPIISSEGHLTWKLSKMPLFLSHCLGGHPFELLVTKATIIQPQINEDWVRIILHEVRNTSKEIISSFDEAFPDLIPLELSKEEFNFGDRVTLFGFPHKNIEKIEYNTPLVSNTLKLFFSIGSVLENGPSEWSWLRFSKVKFVPPSENYYFASYRSGGGASGGPIIHDRAGGVIGVHFWAHDNIAAFVSILGQNNF